MFLGFIYLFNQDLLIWHMKVYVYTKQKGDTSPLLLSSSGLVGDTDIEYHAASVEGTGTPLQYSCLENPMDRGAW